MKTAERAHTPSEMWERIVLDKSYNKALEQIDQNLEYWPEFLKHKSKQRFTRIRQMLVRKRRMKLKNTEEYDIVSRKAEKREKSREVKAEKAALIERHIEETLLQRLKEGNYDDIYNVSQSHWNKLLDKEEIADFEDEQELEEEFDENDLDNIFIEDLKEDNDGDFGDDDGDDEDGIRDNKSRSTKSTQNKGRKLLDNKRRRKPKLEIEYETEDVQHNELLN